MTLVHFSESRGTLSNKRTATITPTTFNMQQQLLDEVAVESLGA